MYRIFTEDVNTESTLNLISAHVPAFTTYEAVGYWKGVRDKSRIFEFVDVEHEQVLTLARDIARLNKQESVLVQQISDVSQLVKAKTLIPREN